MKANRPVVMGFAFAALFAPALGAPANIALTAADDGKTVALGAKECLAVQLATQAGSTGYGWAAAADTTKLLTLKSDGIVEPTNIPGGVETEEFVFCAVAPGKGVLKLEMRRPWEKNVPPVRTFAVKVDVAA